MKTLSRLALGVMLLAATAGVASATYSGPYVDTWVALSGASNNPTGKTLFVVGSLSTCNDSQVTYIQFDATNIATVSSASLELTAASTLINLGTTPKLSIYGVNDIDLSGATVPSAPVTDGLVPIQTIPIPSTTAQFDKFTFGGADPALADHIESQAGGTVTLAIAFSSDCDGNSSTVNFYSQRNTTGTDPDSNDPHLAIEGTKPNAVDVSSTSAERTSLPLYAGLGAVALILVAGLAISRRRTA